MTKSGLPLTPSPLRLHREAQGRGLRDVARHAQVDPAHYSRIERGLARPSVETAVRIALALEVEPGEVLAFLFSPAERTRLFSSVNQVP